MDPLTILLDLGNTGVLAGILIVIIRTFLPVVTAHLERQTHAMEQHLEQQAKSLSEQCGRLEQITEALEYFIYRQVLSATRHRPRPTFSRDVPLHAVRLRIVVDAYHAERAGIW